MVVTACLELMCTVYLLQFGIKLPVAEALSLPVSAILLRNGEAQSERARLLLLAPTASDDRKPNSLLYTQKAMSLPLGAIMQVHYARSFHKYNRRSPSLKFSSRKHACRLY